VFEVAAGSGEASAEQAVLSHRIKLATPLTVQDYRVVPAGKIRRRG
jgi:hypothetical protein